jgi:hypothetical protein
MRPLSQCPVDALAQIRFLLTDIDDTLTDGGRLGAAAYGAIERLRDAGIAVVPVTGRPAGWCDMIARFWPVAGIVGENGAFYFRYRHEDRRMSAWYSQDEAARRVNRTRLEALKVQILAEVPGTAIPSDQAYRLTDLAIDFAEDVPRLNDAAIDRIVALFEAAGASAKVSSIHVNGWFGDFDKLTTSRRLLSQEHNLDLAKDARVVAFIGDSPNDAPMFRAFELSVGVANVADFLDRIETPPTWVAAGRGGAGFVELTEALLAART